MLYLYSGTPGSGKSFHATQMIVYYLGQGRNVISNYPIIFDSMTVKEKNKVSNGHFYFVPDEDLTVSFLCKFALEHHVKGLERQTLLVIDEAPTMFNPRDYGRPDRKIWNKFFALHRHLGYQCILVSQADRLLDRQIRYQIEIDVKHRAANNYKLIGWILELLHIKFFWAISYWYAVKNEKLSLEFVRYNKHIAQLYDSYAMFDVDKIDALAAQADGCSVAGAGGTRSAHPPASDAQNGEIDRLSNIAELLFVLRYRIYQLKIGDECDGTPTL